MCTACRQNYFPEPNFDCSVLKGLTRLQNAIFTGVDLTAFTAPDGWTHLRVLDLSGNRLRAMPQHLTRLVSLQQLMVRQQMPCFQLDQELAFVSQLQHLEQVHMQQNEPTGRQNGLHAWSQESLFHIANASQIARTSAKRKVQIFP